MLKPVKKAEAVKAGGRFAIVASRYNGEYVDAMVRSAQEVFKLAKATVRVVRVPGAFEIPAVASKLASKEPKLSGIVCLGVIFQGQTSHAQHIGWGVTHALAQIQVLHRLPVIHGVFVFEKVKHAKVRCLGAEHNRGSEAAQTALEMARTMVSLGR